MLFKNGVISDDDLQVPISSIRLGGAAPPTDATYKGGLVLGFSKSSNNTIYFTAQLPHKYVEGTDIELHFHWVIPTSGAGIGTENIKWDATCSWSNLGGSFPTETASTTTIDAQNTLMNEHILHSFPSLDGTDKSVSGILICSLTRDVSVANNYNDIAYLVAIDFHYTIAE